MEFYLVYFMVGFVLGLLYYPKDDSNFWGMLLSGVVLSMIWPFIILIYIIHYFWKKFNKDSNNF